VEGEDPSSGGEDGNEQLKHNATAPDASRKEVNAYGSMLFVLRASRHSSELAANATSAAAVNPWARTDVSMGARWERKMPQGGSSGKLRR
jgi:hypothetical protein